MTANLANFSYDPLNYPFLHEAKAIDLFLELLSSPNPKLLHHGTSGLCNLCLGKPHASSNNKYDAIIFKKPKKKTPHNNFPDPTFSSEIVAQNGIQTLSSLLSHSSDQIVQNIIATLLQLDTADLHSQIFTTSNRRCISVHRSSKNPILHNLATVFAECAQYADDLPTNSSSQSSMAGAHQ